MDWVCLGFSCYGVSFRVDMIGWFTTGFFILCLIGYVASLEEEEEPDSFPGTFD